MEDTAEPGTAEAAWVPDPSRYPRTYRVSTRYRVLLLLLAGAALAGGLAGMWYFGTGHETETATEAFAFTALCFGFALLGAALALYALTTKVVLRADAIELHDFLRARRLRRDEIAGWRMLPAQFVSVLALESKRAGTKPLKITRILRTDELFDAWLAGLPNLDVQEWTQSAAELAVRRDLGRTPEERLARLAAARRTVKVLNAVTVGVCVWGFFRPEPYEAAIAAVAALPLVALLLAARSGSVYQVMGHRNDARVSLAAVFITPALILGVRALLDIQLLAWKPALLLTFVVAAALALALAATDRKLRARPWEFLGVLVLSGFYTYGAVVEANALLDRAPAQVYETKVLDKRRSSGRTAEYYLRLAPWGPRETEEKVSVSRELYQMSRRGSTVCVAYRPGALAIGWFIVRACPVG